MKIGSGGSGGSAPVVQRIDSGGGTLNPNADILIATGNPLISVGPGETDGHTVTIYAVGNFSLIALTGSGIVDTSVGQNEVDISDMGELSMRMTWDATNAKWRLSLQMINLIQS